MHTCGMHNNPTPSNRRSEHFVGQSSEIMSMKGPREDGNLGSRI